MVYRVQKIALLRRSCLAATAMGLLCTQAFAQAIPNAADVTKASNRFQERLTGPKSSAPMTRETPGTNEESKNQTFILGNVAIVGMTAFKPGHFSALYKDKIGKSVSVSDMQAIAVQITNAYLDAGYALAIAYLPSQVVDDGQALTIKVDEGRIGKVEFRGDPPEASLLNTMQGYIDKIKRERPLTAHALERYLLFVNDLPGNTARAVLHPSVTDEGATDILIYYAHKNIDAALTVDNRGSRYLGPWQHAASVSENALLGMDERVTTRVITTSPTQELRYGDITYEQAIGSEGTKISAMGSMAQSRPGDSIKTLHAKGESNVVQFKAIHPLLRSRLENLLIRGTADARNNVTRVNGSHSSDDRIRSVRVGASYDLADSMDGVTIIDTETSHGINGLGATDSGTGRARSTGKQDYSKTTLDVSRAQTLPDDFSLLLAGSGQYAFTSLPSSEQFTLGGPSYGTAYDPGEISGDDGITGKVELRYGRSLGDPLVDSYQFYSYYDIGTVWIKNLSVSEQKRESLASAGFGVRVNFSPRVSANLEVALPLTKNLGADTDNGSRIFGGLAISY